MAGAPQSSRCGGAAQAHGHGHHRDRPTGRGSRDREPTHATHGDRGAQHRRRSRRQHRARAREHDEDESTAAERDGASPSQRGHRTDEDGGGRDRPTTDREGASSAGRRTAAAGRQGRPRRRWRRSGWTPLARPRRSTAPTARGARRRRPIQLPRPPPRAPSGRGPARPAAAAAVERRPARRRQLPRAAPRAARRTVAAARPRHGPAPTSPDPPRPATSGDLSSAATRPDADQGEDTGRR